MMLLWILWQSRLIVCLFFFSSRRRHTRLQGDWSSDVCSSDLALTFDRTYDPTLEPNASTDQMMAAVTQLFYVNNWLHDHYYDSGFNEAAGNAQKRSEERRVGKEGRSGGAPEHYNEQETKRQSD